MSEDLGRDLSSVQTLLTKHDAFSTALVAFQPRVDQFTRSKEKLLGSNNSNATAIKAREASLIARWQKLLASADQRKVRLWLQSWAPGSCHWSPYCARWLETLFQRT